jgi:hypothetical protein
MNNHRSLSLLAPTALAVSIALGALPAAAADAPAAATTHQTSVSIAAPSASAVTPRTRVTLAGRVVDTTAEEPETSRPVALQLRTAGGWYTRARTTTSTTGTFGFTVPTYWYGEHTWRVLAPAHTAGGTTFASAASASTAVTVQVPFRTRGSASRFRFESHPVARWDPCRTVPYYLNPQGAPAGALAQVRSALSAVTAATGIRFVYKGRSDRVPWRTGARDNGLPAAGVGFAWTTARTVPALAGSSVGYGGASWYAEGDGPRTYYSGGVALDSSWHPRGTLAQRTAQWRAVLLHETGHVLGLDHVADRTQVMNPISHALTTYGAGDLAGLARLGLDQGCL